jgi:hypothetical protein
MGERRKTTSEENMVLVSNQRQTYRETWIATDEIGDSQIRMRVRKKKLRMERGIRLERAHERD